MTTIRAAIALAILAKLLICDVEAGETREFKIAPQALSQALMAFSEQSQLVVTASSDLLVGKSAPAIYGQMAPETALAKLLEGSGLKYVKGAGGDLSVILVAQDKKVAVGGKPIAGIGREGVLRMAQAETPAPGSGSSTPEQGTQAVADATDSAEDPEGLELEEIIVTAQKRVERLADVPISISVLSGGDLDSSTAEGMTELLNRVPGVATTVGAQGGSTQLAIRGVTAVGGGIFSGSSPIAYYLDSVPFGLVKSAISPDLNAYDLEQVEVLRGPQGTLYGANALNGVVRVLTKDANLDAFEFKGRTALSNTDEGGAENYRGDLAVNIPLVEGKLAVRAVVGYENMSGWIDRPNEDRINDAEVRNYRLKLNARPTEGLSIGLSAWHSNADYGGKSTSLDDGTITATMPEPIAIDFDAYGLKVDYEFAAFTVSSRTSYLDYSNGSLLDVAPLGFPEVFLTDFGSRIFAEELLINSSNTGPWQWSAGAFYRRGKDLLFQTYPEAPGNFYVDYTDRSESSAVFGELSRRFYDNRLKWTLGLRYFQDDVLNKENSFDPSFPPRALYRASDSFDSTTPRAVLTWYPHDDLTVYGSYSEGFRSGFPQNANAPGIAPLQPDKLRNFEIGAKGSLLGGRLDYDAAAYYIDWRDVQQTLTLDDGGVPVTALVNGADASGPGVDFGLTTQPVDGLELGFSFSWNDLTFDGISISSGVLLYDAGERPDLSPEYTVGASLDYAFPLGGNGFRGRFSASANYTSEQVARTVGATARDVGTGDTMLIARTSFSLESASRWTTTLFVDNVNNERGTPVITLGAVPELNLRVRPRTLGVQFEYRF